MKSIVIMYHDLYFLTPSESGFQNNTAVKYKLAVNSFESQVCQVREFITNCGTPNKSVEFTFDDGGESFLTAAAPILEKYGFRGVFFIATKYIGTPGFLSAEQIRELAKRGHIIGSHSHTHPERMSALSPEEITLEWSQSKKILESILGEPVTVASIPNGYSSDTVLKIMTEVGYNKIYTSAPTTRVKRVNNAQIIGRYAVTDSDSTESVLSIVSSPLKRFFADMRFRALGVAKALLGDSYLKIRNLLIK